MNSIEVVCFKKSDIDTVFEIQRAAYKSLYEKYHDDDTSPYKESNETVLRKYTREGAIGYLIIAEGVVVGAVRVDINTENKSGRIAALCVMPQYQGRGIAQKVLLEIERLHPDIERWFLDTILEEEGNCHLYEKLGYRKTGKIEVVNERMTLVFFEKS